MEGDGRVRGYNITSGVDRNVISHKLLQRGILAIKGNINNKVGRNKMAKSRRKKNYKLRRRVMRTVAALTMIMAIVVAAIPVENYGTMQAASGVDMQTVYDAYAQGTYKDSEDTSDNMPSSLGFGSNRTKRVIQVIEDGGIQDRYEVDAKTNKTGSEALITRYVGKSSIIDISEEMSYGYYLFPGDTIGTLQNQWSGEKYTIKYEIVTGQQINGVTIPNTFDLGSIPSSYSTVDPATSLDTSSAGSMDINGIACSYTKTSLSVGELFSNDNAFAGEQFTEYTNRLTDYNSAVKSLVDMVNADGANAATNPNIQTQISDLTDRYNALTKELTVTFQDLKDVPGFVAGVICSRFSIQTAEITSNYSLKGFTLEYLDAINSYAVKWANSNASDIKADIDANSNNDGGFRSSHVDSKGYLCDGFVKVIGIDGNNASGDRMGAFQNDTTITTVDLSDQIKYIGDDAFNGCTALSKANLNAKNCTVVGDRAFKGCGRLSEISFTTSDGTSSVTTLGAEAFQGCGALASVDLPTNIQVIGRGCFANSGLTKFAFASDTTGEVTIYPFAFYGCESLGNVDNTFMPSKDGLNYVIGFGAFGLSGTSSNGSMESFEFPARMTKIDNGNSKNTEFGEKSVFVNAGAAEADSAYDYILAGRKGLKNVIFPENLNGKIPANTLADCENLERAVMGKISFNDAAGRNIGYSGLNLFKDVMYANFRVEGPGYLTNGTDRTQIRKDTLDLKMGLDEKDGVNDNGDPIKVKIEAYVPFMFLDADGNRRMEITVGENGEYLATIDQMDEETRTARLVGYELKSSQTAGSVKDLVVKSEIGGYRITRLGPGCFDKVKDSIETLTIEDNSVLNIDADALKGSPNLRLVRLANSIESIGSGAFEDCPKLENVYFGEPVAVNEGAWGSVMNIDDNAFKTGSKHLTFHGVIEKDYAPFAYAMSSTNTKFNSENTNICYKSLGPANLTVMLDNNTGLRTLIDYPHLEEIDDLNKDIISLMAKRFEWDTVAKPYSIQEKFDRILEAQDRATTDYTGQLEDEERALIDAALHISIPSGVDSIDTKTFFESALNEKSKEYLELLYDESGKEIVTRAWKRAIDTKEYYTDTEDKGIVGGLFSGSFEEGAFVGSIIKSGKQYNDIVYKEDTTGGNDHLTSISLQSVAGLPKEYTFDSCENLAKVDLGSELKDIGKKPFRGCKSLYSEGITGNAYYKAENGIVYGSQEVSDYSVLAECLETAFGNIDKEHNPNLANVKTIAEEAFADCDGISLVDLTETQVTSIPQNCFNGATSLSTVELSKNVTNIEEGAFSDIRGIRGTAAVNIYIPNRNCNIRDTAFDTDPKTIYTIHSYEYTDNTNTEQSAVKNFADGRPNVEFSPIEDGYSVKFLAEGGKLVKECFVSKAGGDVENPPLATDPLLQYEGHIFQTWRWRNSKGEEILGEEAYKNVNEDRNVYAVYDIDPGDFKPDGQKHTITVTDGTIYGEKTFTVPSGTTVMVVADNIDGKTFRNWSEATSKYNNYFGDVYSKTTTFLAQNEDVTLVANFIDGVSKPDPDATYTVVVNYGTGGGKFKAGDTVTITANTPQTGQTFTNWTTATAGVNFASATAATTTFVMPASDVTVTANYSGGGNNPGGDTNKPGDDKKKYKVTVNYGSGSGEYEAGATVNITANAPESSSKVFSRWTTSNSGLGFSNANAVSTSFVMPATDVTVTANYKTRSSSDDDDDDDDDSPSRRPGSDSNTSTVPNRPGNSTNTTNTTGTTGTVNNGSNGTGSTTNNNNGNKIYITKNGISNTDVASLAVSGSTDNFIVKITESPEATAAVEQALTNAYGSLNGLAYLPMDISLYDSTGRNKITDSTGLNITVTMPIPDVLIQYGGNARVAAADNGNLVQLTPRFTTIDGIACISFVPPHFSPYVIYVDTNNLIAGQMLDATPATGDPIHPKWFAAIGMACASILLFVFSDGRKRKKYRAA